MRGCTSVAMSGALGLVFRFIAGDDVMPTSDSHDRMRAFASFLKIMRGPELTEDASDATHVRGQAAAGRTSRR